MNRPTLAPSALYSAVLFVLVAVFARFIPHPPNFACIGALGLFAGCYLRGWQAVVIPLGALALSDWIGQLLEVPGMGFYSKLGMAFVYGGTALAAVIGTQLRNRSLLWVPIAGLSNAVIFYLVSNFGVWLCDGYGPSVSYDRSLAGLQTCYIAALPFFGNSIAGDVFFSSLFFGVYQLAIVPAWSLIAPRSNA